MTRYIVLPTLVVFALGLGAGWALRGKPQRSRDDVKVGEIIVARGGAAALVRTGPGPRDWEAFPSPEADELAACNSHLSTCIALRTMEMAKPAAKLSVAVPPPAVPPPARKRPRVVRAAAYDLCRQRLGWDTNPTAIAAWPPCKTWDEDQDAGR